MSKERDDKQTNNAPKKKIAHIAPVKKNQDLEDFMLQPKKGKVSLTSLTESERLKKRAERFHDHLDEARPEQKTEKHAKAAKQPTKMFQQKKRKRDARDDLRTHLQGAAKAERVLSKVEERIRQRKEKERRGEKIVITVVNRDGNKMGADIRGGVHEQPIDDSPGWRYEEEYSDEDDDINAFTDEEYRSPNRSPSAWRYSPRLASPPPGDRHSPSPELSPLTRVQYRHETIYRNKPDSPLRAPSRTGSKFSEHSSTRDRHDSRYSEHSSVRDRHDSRYSEHSSTRHDSRYRNPDISPRRERHDSRFREMSDISPPLDKHDSRYQTSPGLSPTGNRHDSKYRSSDMSPLRDRHDSRYRGSPDHSPYKDRHDSRHRRSRELSPTPIRHDSRHRRSREHSPLRISHGSRLRRSHSPLNDRHDSRYRNSSVKVEKTFENVEYKYRDRSSDRSPFRDDHSPESRTRKGHDLSPSRSHGRHGSGYHNRRSKERSPSWHEERAQPRFHTRNSDRSPLRSQGKFESRQDRNRSPPLKHRTRGSDFSPVRESDSVYTRHRNKSPESRYGSDRHILEAQHKFSSDDKFHSSDRGRIHYSDSPDRFGESRKRQDRSPDKSDTYSSRDSAHPQVRGHSEKYQRSRENEFRGEQRSEEYFLKEPFRIDVKRSREPTDPPAMPCHSAEFMDFHQRGDLVHKNIGHSDPGRSDLGRDDTVVFDYGHGDDPHRDLPTPNLKVSQIYEKISEDSFRFGQNFQKGSFESLKKSRLDHDEKYMPRGYTVHSERSNVSSHSQDVGRDSRHMDDGYYKRYLDKPIRNETQSRADYNLEGSVVKSSNSDSGYWSRKDYPLGDDCVSPAAKRYRLDDRESSHRHDDGRRGYATGRSNGGRYSRSRSRSRERTRDWK